MGTIDDKYDCAVTTSCSSLDSIVVDTVECGQRCIDFLRDRNLGRANFICLDKLPKRDTSIIETPENAPRIFDLIKPLEDRYANAFYYGVQNTLVGKDLEQANRLAYGAKRFRVVTLDGQLIDISGTMSGGGSRPLKGGMSSKKQAQEYTQVHILGFEQERDESESTLKEVVAYRKDLLLDYEMKVKNMSVLEMQMRKFEMDLEFADKSIEELLVFIQTSK